MNIDLPAEFAGLAMMVSFVMVALVIVVHGSFAYAVWNDAAKAERESERAALVHPSIWGLATLLGGVFAAAAYWFMHHSSLNPRVAAGLHQH